MDDQVDDRRDGQADAHRDGPANGQPGGRVDRVVESDEPRLADARAREIFALAAGASASVSSGSKHAPTLRELMDIATEVGLDPHDVRRAAAIVSDESSGIAAMLTGGPDRHTWRVRLDGAPNDDAAVVDAVERATGTIGRTYRRPGGLEWRGSRGGARTRVLLRSKGGTPELSVEVDQAGLYFWLWVTAALGWGVASTLLGIGGLGLGAAGWLISMVVAPTLIARPFWSRITGRLRPRMEPVVMDLLRALDGIDGGSRPG